jgi:outer membrane protein OmpA-like peptidoglycan-associated protein
VDLSFQTENVVSETADLVFAVEDLAGGVADLGGGAVEIAGPVENLQITETETEIRIELSGDVLFDFDKADIRAAAEPVLTGVAAVLIQHPDAAVTIAGYTDAKGSDSYNLALSERRAASVKAWLVANGGVNGANLTTEGLGETNPVAPNAHPDGSDNPEGRQKNRRVEIAVRK